jgi:hypothetical protein
MKDRGIWLTILKRGVQLNSLTAMAGTTAPIFKGFEELKQMTVNGICWQIFDKINSIL